MQIQDDLSPAQRAESIIAALPPPVTAAAVQSLAARARAAAETGAPEERAEWAELARELSLRAAQLAAEPPH